MAICFITPEELAAIKTAELDLIDVRTPVEFSAGHVPGALNVPLGSLNTRQFSREKPVYLLCKGGVRAKKAAEMLSTTGVNCVHVTGGMDAWIAANLPIEKSPIIKHGISLERQVRMAAGSLVLLGVGLGTLSNAWFLGIAGFVGAGLVFAGLTDWCGMGMLLARCPWNR